MTELEYTKLIKQTYIEIMKDYQTSYDKSTFDNIFIETMKLLIETKDDNFKTTFEEIIKPYLKSIKAISKLSPGLSTGLRDEKFGITFNTYNGKKSDIPNDDDITEETVFDASSMTKMFTAILLLSEAEKGNIDLSKPFSYYSEILKQINVPIIDALRFGVILVTDGRIDEPGISNEEIIRRLKTIKVKEKNTHLYSDIPYMLVPFLFGKTMEEATENYLKKFYEFYRDELDLKQTGYSTINMTGGPINTNLSTDSNVFTYEKMGIYDPKASLLESRLGLISGHAGVTTTVKDLQKLFKAMCDGIISEDILDSLATTVQPGSKVLLDKNNKPIIKDDEPVYIKRGTGVYVNCGDIRISEVPGGYSDKAFAALGSTKVHALFDPTNSFNMVFLANPISTTFSKWINTQDYIYGCLDNEIPKYFQTTLQAGTNKITDGSLTKPNGQKMTYVQATNYFKEESLRTIIKLRIAKLALIKKAYIECSEQDLASVLTEIEETFNTEDKLSNFERGLKKKN